MWRKYSMKTLTKFVAVAGVAALALTACSSGQKASSDSSSDAASKGASFKACAVSDAGGVFLLGRLRPQHRIHGF